MTPPDVHLLLTIRKEETLKTSLLVFDSIRIGFPTARIIVHLNQIAGQAWNQIAGQAWNRAAREACAKVDAQLGPLMFRMRHHEWIQERVERALNPFVICDTDMVFYESVEGWQFPEPLAGAFELDHYNPVTRANHRRRLHTSLLFVRPLEFRDAIRAWRAARPELYYPIDFNPWTPQWIPDGPASPMEFFDTGALAYGAIGGARFSEQQLDAYTHLHCGTWSDVAGRSIPGLLQGHAQIMYDPAAARGVWRQQDQWYQEHQPI